MANVTSVVSHFPKAKEGFTTTLASTIGSGATTVPLNSVTGYTNGDTVVLVIDPGDSTKKQAVTGTVDTSGIQLTSCVWTEGTNTTHTAGATVVDYITATHMSMVSKGMLVAHNPDGSLKTAAVQTALGLGSSPSEGWSPIGATLVYGANNGGKEYTMTAASDLRTTLTPGMRLRLARSTTPPTQCADFESASSQYAVRLNSSTINGMSFTDDFTVEAWIKIESYTGSVSHIASRFSSGVGGWQFRVDSDGQLGIIGYNTTNYRFWQSNTAVPVGQWVHVAATLDMSGGASTMYINGAAVSPTLSSIGTPTALVQGGDLMIGNATGTSQYFDGKVMDVRIWSTIRTATEIRANMNVQLAGNESGLVSYYKLDGNFNDTHANANNLSAQGGVVATNVDNAMNATEYAIIQKVAYSAPTTTITVTTGTDYNIPNGTLTAPYYSLQAIPYGFPADVKKWTFTYLSYTRKSTASPVANTWYNAYSFALPAGEWVADYHAYVYGDRGANGEIQARASLSTVNNAQSDTRYLVTNHSANTTSAGASLRSVDIELSLTASTTYYLNYSTPSTSISNVYVISDQKPFELRLRCPYV